MALFDLETDPTLELGVPIVFADFESVRLTIARSTDNERLRLEVERATRPLRGRVGPAADIEREHAILIAWCKVCLLKWETLVSTMLSPTSEARADADKDGYVVGIDFRGVLCPLTAEKATAVFETRGLEQLREQAVGASRNAAHYRKAAREADTGN